MQKQGFTLAELLVVVLVMGVLAAVAVPKYKRLLETSRTTEAEQVLAAVRNEQERRCLLGKDYLQNTADLSVLDGADASPSYTYSLQEGGVTATRSDASYDYALRMISYKDGRICCQGSYCDSLNRSYPACDSLEAVTDECIPD